LVDIPPPQPRAGQALVHVTSAGVTPLDRTVLAPARSGASARARQRGRGRGHRGFFWTFGAGERVLFFAGPGGVTQDGTFAKMASEGRVCSGARTQQWPWPRRGQEKAAPGHRWRAGRPLVFRTLWSGWHARGLHV